VRTSPAVEHRLTSPHSNAQRNPQRAAPAASHQGCLTSNRHPHQHQEWRGKLPFSLLNAEMSLISRVPRLALRLRGQPVRTTALQQATQHLAAGGKSRRPELRQMPVHLDSNAPANSASSLVFSRLRRRLAWHLTGELNSMAPPMPPRSEPLRASGVHRADLPRSRPWTLTHCTLVAPYHPRHRQPALRLSVATLYPPYCIFPATALCPLSVELDRISVAAAWTHCAPCAASGPGLKLPIGKRQNHLRAGRHCPQTTPSSARSPRPIRSCRAAYGNVTIQASSSAATVSANHSYSQGVLAPTPAIHLPHISGADGNRGHPAGAESAHGFHAPPFSAISSRCAPGLHQRGGNWRIWLASIMLPPWMRFPGPSPWTSPQRPLVAIRPNRVVSPPAPHRRDRFHAPACTSAHLAEP